MESSFNTSENMIIKDKETLAYKLKQFISDGVSSLQVITDFDQTLTKYMVDGCRGSSTFAVLHESNFVSKELIRKSQENYEYYSKIEQDQTISTEDKWKHMDEWWGQALTNIVQESISKNDFENMTRDSNLCFRNGIRELIELKKKLKFPFVIVSAGIGEIIKSAFHLLAEEQKIDDEFINSIDILSNLGIYDEGDTIIGFESPIQTVMNKNENI